mmetsp:Transcript_2609/g.2970  ORF Transcript_2609/g.2970 Transcript_2609/m.2970 type:complete len:553 (-) Transcript_2609:1293-2951(-)
MPLVPASFRLNRSLAFVLFILTLFKCVESSAEILPSDKRYLRTSKKAYYGIDSEVSNPKLRRLSEQPITASRKKSGDGAKGSHGAYPTSPPKMYDPMIILTNKSKPLASSEKETVEDQDEKSNMGEAEHFEEKMLSEKDTDTLTGKQGSLRNNAEEKVNQDAINESIEKVGLLEGNNDVSNVDFVDANAIPLPLPPNHDESPVQKISTENVELANEMIKNDQISWISLLGFPFCLIVAIGYCAVKRRECDLMKRRGFRQNFRRGFNTVRLYMDRVPVCNMCMSFLWKTCNILASKLSFQQAESRVKITKGNVEKKGWVKSIRQRLNSFFLKKLQGDKITAEREKLNKAGAMKTVEIIRLKEIASPREFVPQLHSPNLGFRSILDQKCLVDLLPYIPARVACKDWSLQYASDLHGYSLLAAYRACKEFSGPCLLAIMDTRRHVFGVFCSEPLHLSRGSYYGTGETFLFKLRPQLSVYEWSGKNSQFILGGQDMIAFGGGGKFALWLDSSFEKGTSENGSPTFDSPCIASNENFECAAVEIWNFVNPAHVSKHK